MINTYQHQNATELKHSALAIAYIFRSVAEIKHSANAMAYFSSIIAVADTRRNRKDCKITDSATVRSY